MKKHLFTLAVFLMVFIVSACSLGRSSNQPNFQENPWGLIKINQGNLLEGSQITLKFEENQVTGSAGCNLYSATTSEPNQNHPQPVEQLETMGNHPLLY